MQLMTRAITALLMAGILLGFVVFADARIRQPQ